MNRVYESSVCLLFGWSGNLRNIKHHGFVVTMVRTGTFMNKNTFKFVGVFPIGGVPIPKEFVHIQHNRK